MSVTAETSAQSDSPYHQYVESSTPCITDTQSRWLPFLQTRGVNNYLQQQPVSVTETLTDVINRKGISMESLWITISLIREAFNSLWHAELSTPCIIDTQISDSATPIQEVVNSMYHQCGSQRLTVSPMPGVNKSLNQHCSEFSYKKFDNKLCTSVIRGVGDSPYR